MSVERLLRTPSEIRHVSLATDRYGNEIKSPNGEVETVNCFKRAVAEQEMLNQEDVVVTTWRLIYPPGTNITEDDQIFIDNELLEVTGVGRARNPRTNLEHHLVVHAVSVKR